MISTILTTEEKTVAHPGTAGFTVTSTRDGNDVFTEIEYSSLEPDELREMMCSLLCMLDEKAGERFVASCFARYAEETGKKVFVQENGKKLAIIRG